MKLGILKEIAPLETRVAQVPDTTSKLLKTGLEVLIEKDAGEKASFSDAEYEKSGAKIAENAAIVWKDADIIAKVQKPQPSEISSLKNGSVLVSPLYPLQNLELIMALNAANVTAFALDMIPRIARAQSMDILSSQSSVAGYKSVLMAANMLGKIFPMMTTAAGTIPPAKVIVIGAGVAGLQAIATARRLGGVVIAFDTRPAAGEQVKSLGADFVSLETSHEQSQDTGGYATEQSAAFYQHEQETINQYLSSADIVITTALIPGKRAPLLITDEMVKTMKPGSIIVDLASEQQGNCELTEPGKVVIKHGVHIVGTLNLPSTVPVHASQLYAKNVANFIQYLLPQLTSGNLDLEDDLIKGCLICHKGEIVHPALKKLLEKGSTHAA